MRWNFEKVNGHRVVINDWRLRWSRMYTLPCFMAGFVCAIGWVTHVQDRLGLEKYIELCRKHWVDMHWGVGLAISLAMYFAYRSLYRKERAMHELMYADYREEAIEKGISDEQQKEL